MTNVNSGYKRTWDGAGTGAEGSDSSKRARAHAHTQGEPRDWRDVHLKSPARVPPPPQGPHSRRGSVEKERRSRREREEYRRGSDYARDRERERERDRDRDRDRGRRDDRPRTRTRSRSSSRSKTKTTAQTNGVAKPTPMIVDEEKEEGEISPYNPPPSHSSKASPPPSKPESKYTTSPGPQAAPKPVEKEVEMEMELDLPPSPPPVEDVLAARRARRLAILAKYKGGDSAGASPSPSSAVQPPPPSSVVSDAVSRAPSVSDTPGPGPHAHGTAAAAAAGTPGVDSSLRVGGLQSKRESMSTSPAPEDFALAKDDDEDGDMQTKEQEQTGNTYAVQISAADYDPSLDRREDEQRRIKEPVPKHTSEMNGIEEEVEEIEEDEEDDVDDMFAVATSDKKKVKKVRKKVIKPAAPALITTTLDSAADPDGYYTVILGEQLDGGRYQVFSSIGKGMFANVVRARVLQGEIGEAGKEVAIKIVRCQDSMYRAGLKEVQILNKLKQADPEDKKHIVRLERTFEHRGHLCLVFESMSMNLRDVVKRFGKDVGLNIRAVRAYAHQLFLALSLLRKTNIMHADIKPDNILVNEQKTVLKLCDLGSASDASENDITPYLVSRFYRAPEIIMGVPYDPALDIWSIGCTLYELYTGKILFPGRSNNQMLLLMMELKGRFNGKMIKKAKFGDVYFDEMGGFESVERDRLTGNDVVKKVHISKPSRDLRARLMPPASVKMKDDESKMLLAFIDLLDKCLALDPARRITPREALAHPFVRG